MAIATRSEEFKCGGCTPNNAALSGLFLPIISPFNTATIEFFSTVGCEEYQREPNNPLSSAPCHTNNAERLPGFFLNALAMANNATLTLALSSAPLYIESLP